MTRKQIEARREELADQMSELQAQMAVLEEEMERLPYPRQRAPKKGTISRMVYDTCKELAKHKFKDIAADLARHRSVRELLKKNRVEMGS